MRGAEPDAGAELDASTATAELVSVDGRIPGDLLPWNASPFIIIFLKLSCSSSLYSVAVYISHTPATITSMPQIFLRMMAPFDFSFQSR
jgi:hypothetical protein